MNRTLANISHKSVTLLKSYFGAHKHEVTDLVPQACYALKHNVTHPRHNLI
jgi:hypothetical protein